MSDDPAAGHPPILSFVRRRGRITPAQQRAIDDLSVPYGPPTDAGPVDLPRWFGRAGPALLEIGFGNGDALLAFAGAHPDWNCIGVEVYPPGVGALLNAVHQAGLDNVRVVQTDAMGWLRQRLVPASLDRLHLFFPDPWPKKRHHKRRLVQAPFVALAGERLRAGGLFCLATDWTPYATQMLAVLEADPRLTNTGPGYAPRPEERPLTRFERRGERLGHQVHDLIYRRSS